MAEGNPPAGSPPAEHVHERPTSAKRQKPHLTRGQKAQLAAYASGIDDTTDQHDPRYKSKDAKDNATS